MQQEDFGQTTPRVIETASATTSPDNANSGPRAYLITAFGLLAAMFLALSMGSCVAATLKSAYYLVEDDVVDYLTDTGYLDPSGGYGAVGDYGQPFGYDEEPGSSAHA